MLRAGDAAAPAETSRRTASLLRVSVLVLLVYRLAYHLVYLLENPFALATFSDGSLYEAAARDIVAAPPWGTRPFYLQGLYAYQLAAGLTLSPDILSALLLQLLLAALALFVCARAFDRLLPERESRLSLLLLCAYFPLAFYENKYLSAAQGVFANALVWLAFSMGPGTQRNVWVGAASGLSLLARPNLLLSVPFTAWALVRAEPPKQRIRTLAWFITATLLTLAPMAVRNLIVTGHATVMPSHGGGTSFYIGNNPSARGRWNDAGGLLSGQVGLERSELLRKLDIPSRGEIEDARAIGDALYARAFAFIREDPLRWLALEARKTWLLFGNDELSQDYDFFGERELLPPFFGFGVPFGVICALALIGLVRAWQTPEQRGLLWLLGGQLLASAAANIVYFTSSQHRLPLAVGLCACAGSGAVGLVQTLRGRASGRAHVPPWLLGLSGLLLIQAFVPRTQQAKPSLAHHYNLALAAAKAGSLPLALTAISKTIAARPRDGVFRVERASLLRRMGQFAAAQADLDQLDTLHLATPWLAERAHLERQLLARRSLAPAESATRSRP